MYKRILAIAAVLLAHPAAAQSAFPQPKGEGRLIATALTSESKRGFDDDGDTVNIRDYRQRQAYFFTEYGLTDALTLIVTPSLRDISIEGPGGETSGLGFTDLGGRYHVDTGGGWIVSAQGLVRIPGKKRRENIAQTGSTDTEWDLRLGAARGFSIGGRDAFVTLSAGYRFRSDDPPNHFELDATLGYRPTSKLLLLATTTNTISDGRGRGIFDDERYHNAYLSGVYDLSRTVSLQIGGYGTVAGDNALRERGGFVGLWYRF